MGAAPRKTQRRVRRDLPADRVPWPFRGCTVAEAEEAAGVAQLTTPDGVTVCATCGVTVCFKSHYSGEMHVARTKAAADHRGVAKEAPRAPAPLSQRSDVALCRRRMGEDPEFAALLAGPQTNDGHPSGRPADTLATMDVDRLLEL
ncbi:hypothetical protein HPB52_008097 [Rhipicephalus sanguineus]|uniref:Uncharacterized protein n=1 Tax=Rhipicephalus sanguineus TaxID=34632 RepID=A0A9D4QHG9_RHISA|nr:hypothetical protein HPB52_008097 [Rhipicephalus sanguineus]